MRKFIPSVCACVTVWLLVFVVSCTHHVPPPPPAAALLVDVSVHDEDQNGVAVVGAVCTDGTVTTTTNESGDGAFGPMPAGQRMIVCRKDGYDEGHTIYTLVYPVPQIVVVRQTRQHVDPSRFSLEQLAQVRGAMWTARVNVPYGPRPNQDSNILAMAYYDVYGEADRLRMIAQYKSQGYTHSVTGPVTGNDCYHNLYPCHRGVPSQAEWDRYLDSLQELWDNGIIPIYFAHPDGWTLPADAGRMDTLDSLYRQPRAQQLLRVVVYSGWEPSGSKYGWNNDQYVAWAKRGAQVFPHALRGLHTAIDLDAPTGQDDNIRLPGGNAEAWRRIAPYIHVWFDQVGGYVFGGTEQPSAGFLSEFGKHVRRCVSGFNQGFGGWPTTSAWGYRPIVYVAAEYAAYGDFWWNWHEKYAQDIGDLAIASGAQGYLDGGRVAVR